MRAMLVGALIATGCLGPTLTERESMAQYRWAVRGQEAGALARAYCLEGSERERRWMREAFEHHAQPARVTVTCP